MPNSNIHTKELLTTGEAASILSVTSDAVLKWVKAGKLPAQRTPGGHYRIRKADLLNNAEPSNGNGIKAPQKSFKYCWEFNSDNGEMQSGCRDCIVYKSRTLRCYEMMQLPEKTGHAKLYCDNTCEDCSYYSQVRGERPNVLIITDERQISQNLHKRENEREYNVKCTNCEYECSAIVEEYRPDYVIIDCSIGTQKAQDFTRHIAEDPRIPLVRMIIVGEELDMQYECNKAVFARIQKPFTLSKMEDLVVNLRKDSKYSELTVV